MRWVEMLKELLSWRRQHGTLKPRRLKDDLPFSFFNPADRDEFVADLERGADGKVYFHRRHEEVNPDAHVEGLEAVFVGDTELLHVLEEWWHRHPIMDAVGERPMVKG